MPGRNDKKVAVLIPCYNEAGTIEKVIRDYRGVLPDADIYVYDNNSNVRSTIWAMSWSAA